MNPQFGRGLACVLGCVLLWGVQFPVAKSALASIDFLQMNSIRYGLGTLLLFAVLAWREGAGAIDFRGRFGQVAAFGFLGMGVSPMLLFYGLSLSLPEHTAVVVSLQPSMTALADWWLHGRRPANFTLAAVAVAFSGVLLVVTRGELSVIAGGHELLGDLFVVLSAICWVAYTMSAETLRGWPALQFTVLSLISGTVGAFAVTAVALAAGWIAPASMHTLAGIGWHLAYLALGGVVLGMLFWTAGNQRIGALNSMLLLNMVPIVTFGVRYALGARFSAAELAGAALVIGALAANNAYLRRKMRPA